MNGYRIPPLKGYPVMTAEWNMRSGHTYSYVEPLASFSPVRDVSFLTNFTFFLNNILRRLPDTQSLGTSRLRGSLM
jgi:hypothetical protein